MALKPSLGTPSNSIPTSHYYGPNGDAPPKYEGNPGRSSFGVTFAPSFVFNNKSSAQTWNDLMQHTVHVTQMDGYYLVNSSNKVIAIPIASDWERFGPNIAANMDDIGENIAGWRKATEESHAISYGELPGFQLFITQRHEHLADHVLNKYITGIAYYGGPLNDLGKHMHQSKTLRQDWNRFLASKEGQELATQKGNIDGVEYLGVWPAERVIYAVGRAKDGKIILLRGNNSHDILADEADFIGVALEDMVKASLGEEATHIARKSFDKVSTTQELIAEERATKAELLAFYKSLAKGAESKPELKGIYDKLARLIEYDIATTAQRYSRFAEQQFGGNELVQKLVAEAYANGMETEQEVWGYVAAKSMESSESAGKSASMSVKGDNRGNKNATAGNEQKSAENSGGSNNETAGGNPEGSSAPESGESAPSSE